jgi:hypothetical protein
MAHPTLTTIITRDKTKTRETADAMPIQARYP